MLPDEMEWVAELGDPTPIVDSDQIRKIKAE